MWYTGDWYRYPWCQIMTPLVYDESLSYEQQIAHLFSLLKNTVSKSELENFIEFMKNDQIAQSGADRKYTDDEINKLNTAIRELIEGITAGNLQWDCQNGVMTDTVTAQRDMFNDLAIHALDVDDLTALNIDVDGLSDCGLNVRGVAVYSGVLKDECPFVPSGIIYNQASVPGSAITCEALANGVIIDKFFKEK